MLIQTLSNSTQLPTNDTSVHFESYFWFIVTNCFCDKKNQACWTHHQINMKINEMKSFAITAAVPHWGFTDRHFAHNWLLPLEISPDTSILLYVCRVPIQLNTADVCTGFGMKKIPDCINGTNYYIFAGTQALYWCKLISVQELSNELESLEFSQDKQKFSKLPSFHLQQIKCKANISICYQVRLLFWFWMIN